VGLPIADRWDLHRRLHGALGRGPSTGQPIARAALDTALHDLCARAAGLTLRSFLGGADTRNTVALSFTLTAHDPSAIAEEVAAAREQGYRHFNFKAAVTPETDVAVADAIRQASGPGAFVWADANQGFHLHQARRAAQGFLDAGVDVLEQPLPADQLPLMRQLRAGCALPLAVDEASVGPTEFLHYAAERLVDYLVIKLTRNGGVWPTVQQIAIAEAAGLPLLVSGLTESLLAKVAACQVAIVFGFAGPAALNGSQFLDESALYPDKSTIERAGTVHLPDTPGLGVRPDECALQDFLAKDVM
jgi:muconate cycloisomerase